MTSFLNSLAEFTKRDYAFVQPDSPEADAVFINSISHIDGKVWVNQDPRNVNRTSFSNADFDSPKEAQTRPNSWEGAALSASQWAQSAASMMADTFANSAKYMSDTVQKNSKSVAVKENGAANDDENQSKPRRSTIPSLYGASADDDDLYDSNSRSTIYIVQSGPKPKEIRRRAFTAENIEGFSRGGENDFADSAMASANKSNPFVQLNSWIGFSSSHSFQAMDKAK